VRQELEAVDPNVTVFDVRRMEDLVEEVYQMARLVVRIYGALGIFALILSTVGLAGITAYSVARRTHEIGIRIALGASRRSILGLVLSEAAVILGVGGLVGLGLALAAMRALGSVLNAMAEATRTSATEPALLVGGPALLVTLAFIACYWPARRSTRIDPTTALRTE
jgi:putative ABC transport system permease protein